MADPSPRARVLHDLKFIANVSQTPADSDTLADDLSLDHSDFVYLAASLRAFIRVRRPKKTITVYEIEKDSTTVLSLIQLVEQRIK